MREKWWYGREGGRRGEGEREREGRREEGEKGRERDIEKTDRQRLKKEIL